MMNFEGMHSYFWLPSQRRRRRRRRPERRSKPL